MVATGRRPYHRSMMDRVITAVVGMQTRWHAFVETERGASMVEYAIMVSMIAIVAPRSVSTKACHRVCITTTAVVTRSIMLR